MNLNHLKIRFIQTLLNLNKNFKYFNIIFLFSLLFLTSTIFGVWNLLVGYYHIFALMLFLAIIVFFLKANKKYFKFVSYKYSVNWLEEKNFKNSNPFVAIQDRPAEKNHNKSLWKAHIKQSQAHMSNINFYKSKII